MKSLALLKHKNNKKWVLLDFYFGHHFSFFRLTHHPSAKKNPKLFTGISANIETKEIAADLSKYLAFSKPRQ